MLSRQPYNPGPYGDDWEDVPQGLWWQTWGLGLLAAAAVGGYGVRTLVTRAFDFESQRASEHLHGVPAVAIGIALLGVGLLLFCHYFIQTWRPMAWYAVLGKIVALLAIIGGLGTYVVGWFAGWH